MHIGYGVYTILVGYGVHAQGCTSGYGVCMYVGAGVGWVGWYGGGGPPLGGSSRRGAVSRPDWVLTIISSHRSTVEKSHRSQVRRRRGVSSCAAPTYPPTQIQIQIQTQIQIQIQIQIQTQIQIQIQIQTQIQTLDTNNVTPGQSWMAERVSLYPFSTYRKQINFCIITRKNNQRPILWQCHSNIQSCQ